MPRSRKTDFLREVVKADPDYYRDKLRQPEYEFSNGRKFVGNPAKRGPYAPQEEQS